MMAKQIKPLYPPIDPVRACILDRKHSMKLSWSDIGRELGISGGMMRYWSQFPPDDWPKDVRNGVCRVLGIKVKQTVEDLTGI